MSKIAIPTREAVILGALIISATIISLNDKSMAARWFELMNVIVGGILGFATQAAYMKSNSRDNQHNKSD